MDRHPRLDQLPDLLQAGFPADGCGTRTAQLDAVVARRIVTGGEHRAREAEAPRGEVQTVRAGKADQDDVASLCADPLGEGRHQLIARRAHVLADDHRTGAAVLATDPQDVDQGSTDATSEVGIELLGHESAHVIGLEDLVESGGAQGGWVAG